MDARHRTTTGQRLTRRGFLRLASAGAGLAATTAGGIATSIRDIDVAAQAMPAAPSSSSDNRPNIVFINTDDLDAASMSAMPKVQSLLTDRGTSFSNYLLNVSLCCPSRTSFLRGQYAHNTRVLNNDRNASGGYETAHALGLEQSTIATWLQSAGYRTALMGKYLNGYRRDDTVVPPGWNEWYGSDDGYGQFNYRLNENGVIVQYGNRPEDFGTDVLANKATDFITRAAAANVPFFAYIAPFSPHGPATPAPRYADAFADAKAPRPLSYNEADVSDKPQWVRALPPLSPQRQAEIDAHYRRRLQSLQAVDDLVERVVNTLQMADRLDRTYIVFSSDNGFHLGQHREPTGKQAPYEADIRVPLIVRGPGVAAGKAVDALAGNVDLAPTFAEWGGAATPDFLDGRSVAPLLRGETPPAWRQAFMIAHYRDDQPTQGGAMPTMNTRRANATPAAVAARGRGLPNFTGLRTAGYTYVEYASNERELYDLTRDPDQLSNLASTADPALLTRLSTQLAAITGSGGATLRTAEQQTAPAPA